MKQSSPTRLQVSVPALYAVAVLACLLLVYPASAQVTGRLSGTVEDPSGKPVSGARVTLELMDSMALNGLTTTSGAGTFLFPSLRPIFYELTVESPGFKKFILMGVKVDPASEASLPPIKLVAGDVSAPPTEQEAQRQTLQTSNGEVASTATGDQVNQLPLSARNPLDVLDTLPGVQENGRAAPTIDGESVSFQNITFDGVNIQQSYYRFYSLKTTTLDLRTDQIGEVTVVTSNPGAIYTGGSGQVAFSTPSGTNTIHGTAYWLNIPGGVGAQYFLNNSDGTPATTKLNQVGASVGGAIKKDKLFFFLNYEANIDRSTVTTPILPVPTSPLYSANPVMEQVLSLIPWSPTGSWQGTQNNGNTTYTGLARFDYRASSKHVFAATASWLDGLTDEPYTLGISSYYGRQPDVTVHNVTSFFSTSWRWSPTAHLTNEVRIGANLPKQDFLNSIRQQFPFVAVLGFAYPQSEPMYGFDPQAVNDSLYSYQDNLTYVKGRHTLQAGFSLQQYRITDYGVNYNPLFSFTAPTYYLYTFDQNGNFVNDLGAGTVYSAIQPFNIKSPTSGYVAHSVPESNPSTNLVSGYFQDNWKVRPSLSINLGVRYDYFSPVEDRSGTSILPNITGANGVYNQNMAFNFVPGGQGLYKPDRDDFAPHVGFAWKVSEKIPVVVRGAYSISYVNDDLLSKFALFNPFQSPYFQTNLGNGVPIQSVPSAPTPALPPLTLPGLSNLYGGFTPPIWAVNPNLRTPYVQQANLGVETQLKGFQFGARYVGNRLVKGLVSVDRNPLQLQQPGALAYIESNGAGLNVGTYAQFFQEVFNGLGVSLPYNYFGNPLAANGINVLGNSGRSHYDSLQLTASRRVATGLSFTASYAYSKTLGNLDDGNSEGFYPLVSLSNPSLNYAPSPYNLASAFKSTLIYDLPFAAHTASSSLARKVLGGWSLSGIMIAQSGAPFSLLSGLDTANTPQDSGQSTVSTSLTAGQIQQYFGIDKNPAGYLTYVNNAPASAFQEPAPGTNGNLQRRMFTGPGAFNLNLGVRKVVTLTERARMEFRAESINVLNKENWAVGDQTLGTNASGQPAFFGNITQWTPPRSLQFQLRLLF